MRKVPKNSEAGNQSHSLLFLNKDWNSGYNAGAAAQRKADIENVVRMLEDLEQMPGIGDKTAWKIRKLFLDSFGK